MGGREGFLAWFNGSSLHAFLEGGVFKDAVVHPAAGLCLIIDKRLKSPTCGVCLLIELHSARFIFAFKILFGTNTREAESAKYFF